MHFLQIYMYLITIRIKGQTSYHKSFCVEIFAYLLQMATHIGGIFFIFYHIKTLAGWSLWEVLYLYGITSLSFSLAQLTAECFEDLHLYIKSGEFDQMLIKPISPIIQIAALSFRIERLGGLLQSLVVLIVAGIKIGVFNSMMGLMIMNVSILSMFVIYYALFLANGAFSFWSLESSEMFNAFTYGGVEVAKYPLSIYPKWMQILFLYCIPLGFVSYLPALELLGKSGSLSIWTPPVVCAPLVALIFLCLIFVFWKFSLKHYQSTGS